MKATVLKICWLKYCLKIPFGRLAGYSVTLIVSLSTQEFLGTRKLQGKPDKNDEEILKIP